MFTLRKWLYKPKKDDSSILAQFFYADEELNLVAAELDSFDGRKDPERCTALVNLLRHSQDKVLNICNQIMDEAIPEQHANRDFRVKFPDDVLQENLGGQLWFGAECLAAGSSILNREVESANMRPLAKNLTKALDDMRNMLREQCLKNPTGYSEKVKESLRLFDQLFAEFELSYVSAMVPVKTMKEYNMQQNVIVLFSETLQRALKLGLLTQECVDDYDPALMFTIPRLAIVCGLLIFPDGALCVDGDPRDMSEMFRPFHNLLFKIRDLLWTLNQNELLALEKVLCSVDEPVVSWSDAGGKDEQQQHGSGSGEPRDATFHLPSVDDYIQNLYRDYPSCKQFITDFASFIAPAQDVAQLLPTTAATATTTTNSRRSRSHGGESPLLRRRRRPAVAGERAASAYVEAKELEEEEEEEEVVVVVRDGESEVESMDEDDDYDVTTIVGFHEHGGDVNGCTKCRTVHSKVGQSTGAAAAPPPPAATSSPRRIRSPLHEPSPAKRLREVPLCRRVFSQPQDVLQPSTTPSAGTTNRSPSRHSAGTASSANVSPSNWDSASFCSTETSSYNSECQDDEEIALAMQAAEIANRQGLRSRFKDGQDLVHRLFVCISGVADQLQTNHASDFRNILKCVFEMNCTQSDDESTDHTPSGCRSSFPELSEERVSIESAEEASERNTFCEEAPTWIPDDLAPMCMSCETPFNLVRRRHHCRNCGKVFCGRCSSNSVPLPRFGLAKPVRVCNRCYMFQVTPFVISTDVAGHQQHVQD